MGKDNKMIYLLMLLVAFSWGGAFNAAAFALADIPPLTVAFFRFALATVILLPVSLISGAGIPSRKDSWLGFFLLGLTGVAAYNTFFLTGMQATSPVNGSLIVAASPMVTAVLAALFLKEIFTLRQLGGVLLSFTGVALVASGGSLQNLLALQINRGDSLLLGAMFSWSLYAIVGKSVMARSSPLASTTYGCMIGALLLLPFALAGDPGFSSLAHARLPAVLAVLYLALIASVLAFWWWNQGVSALGAGRASVFLNLIPVSTMVISLFLGEAIFITQLAGCALVISGVTLTAQLQAQPRVDKAAA